MSRTRRAGSRPRDDRVPDHGFGWGRSREGDQLQAEARGGPRVGARQRHRHPPRVRSPRRDSEPGQGRAEHSPERRAHRRPPRPPRPHHPTPGRRRRSPRDLRRTDHPRSQAHPRGLRPLRRPARDRGRLDDASLDAHSSRRADRGGREDHSPGGPLRPAERRVVPLRPLRGRRQGADRSAACRPRRALRPEGHRLGQPQGLLRRRRGSGFAPLAGGAREEQGAAAGRRLARVRRARAPRTGAPWSSSGSAGSRTSR